MGAWLELFRALGQALVELVKAELAALGEDLAASGRKLGAAIALLGAAAAVAFWAVAVLLYTVIQLIALALPLWAAAAIVFGVCALAVGVLAGIAVVKLRRLESPARILERRLADHREWWDRRLLADAESGPAPGARPREELP
jgi:hypothetical protein